MKLWSARAACICLAISLGCVAPVRAQDAVQTFAFANALFESGDFEAAALHYQRVIHFTDDDRMLFTAYERTAGYWQSLDSINRANAHLLLAYHATEDRNAKTRIALQRTENFILQKLFFEALEELLSINESDPETRRAVQFYEAVIRFGLGQYDASEQLFLAYSDSLRYPASAAEIRRLFNRNERLNRINPKTAMYMSMVVPGSGQIYVGDYRNGINSLLLNGFFAFLFIHTTINNGILEGATSVLPWYYRYYSGGYKRAENIAIERIAERRARIYRQVLRELPSE